MRKRVLGAAALTVTMGLAACGGDSDDDAPAPAASGQQRGILRTIDELQAASRSGDAGRICRQLFTSSLASSIESASGRRCRAVVKQRFTSPRQRLAVSRQVVVEGSRATAVIRERDGDLSRLVMVKDGGRWRIARVEPVKRA